MLNHHTAHRKITSALFLTAVAAMLNIGIATADTFGVPGDPTNGPPGTNLVTGPISSTDILSLTVSGSPFLQGTGSYGTNAAGVVTTAGGPGYPVGSALAAGGFDYGALLITLNGVTKQVFATDAANGLGSPTPYSELSITDPLSFWFGNFGTFSNPMTTINFKVWDTDYTNNGPGGFTVVESIAAPEIDPTSAACALTLLLGALAVLSGAAPNRRFV